MTKPSPQRLYHRAVVCDSCGSLDSFRVTGKYRNVDYLKCVVCGRRATRLRLDKPAAKPPRKP